MISTAEAPSVIWEELPAVTLPSSLNAGFRFANVATEESARMPSSDSSSVHRWRVPRRLGRRPGRSHYRIGPRLSPGPRAGDSRPKRRRGPRARRPTGRRSSRRRCPDSSVHRLARSAPRRSDRTANRSPCRSTSAHGHARHHFDTGRDDHVIGARHHALGGKVQRLLGRSALAVNRRGGHRLRPPGREHRASSDVERLLADLGHAAHDHVVD
jgi:hypothetical protein